MHILIITQGNTDLMRYKAKLKARGDTYEEERISSFLWEDGHPDRVWMTRYIDELYRSRRETVDLVKFFLEDWHAARGKNGYPVNGRSYARHYKYPVHLVRVRNGDDDTAEHEDLHTVNDDVATYLGISLSQIMKVEDFDEDVVHGRDPRFTEYDYDRVWNVVLPFAQAAYRRKKQFALLTYSNQALILLRKALARKKQEEIEAGPVERLLDEIEAAIGTDASPSDLAPDELGCAETASNIMKRVFPHFPVVTGTWSLLDVLTGFSGIERVTGDPKAGDIVLYATGQGLGIYPGHVGFVDRTGKIASNNSPTGTFEQNYTLESFRRRYVHQGGFPEHIFRITTKHL